MKAINWLRFTWDLTTLPDSLDALPEHYDLTLGGRDDEKELRRVIASSFTLDPTWNPDMQEVIQTIDTWLDRAGEKETTRAYLALRHGQRIIGGSVVTLEPDAENQLWPGPCILVEYRNRGFGTNLLHRSLLALRDAGHVRAAALAKENSPATKFLYPKFNGIPAPWPVNAAVLAA